MNLPEGATFVDRKDKVITEVFPLFMILRWWKTVPTIKKSFSSSKITAICNVWLDHCWEGGMEKLEKLNRRLKPKDT
jgi:hypothetical protein